MSWLKSVSLSAEGEVFDENADELNLQSREWCSNMKRRVRDGYVDGVDAGEEASLQQGFNLGFREGAAQTAAVSRLKGVVTAIWCWCESRHPEHPAEKQQTVSELLRKVAQHEESILEDMERTLKNPPPPSVSDISEAMEDLGAGSPVGAGGGCCGVGACQESGCCRGENIMQMDVSHSQQPHTCPGTTDSLGNELSVLIQECAQLVTELGLLPEISVYIESLKTI